MNLFKSSKIFKLTKNDLVIEEVSNSLLKYIHFEFNELKGKHVSILLPKYFLIFDKIIIEKKVYCLLASKERQYLPVKLCIKTIDNRYITICVKFVKKRMYNNLIDYQLFFDEINRTAQMGIIIFNDKGYVVHCNEAACKMYRYSFHEFMGIHGTTFIHPSIHNEFYRLLNHVETDEFFNTYSIEVRKDKTTFKSYVSGKILKTKYGKFAIAFVSDITKEQELQQELIFHKDLFKKVFDLSPVGFFIYDEHGLIIDANNEIIRQLNVNRDILIGSNIHIVKNKELYEALLKPINEKSNGEYSGYYTSINSGKTIYTKFISIPFRIFEKNYGIGISLDLTTEKRIENELNKKNIFYQKLFDNALAGIGITDFNENIIYANEAFARIIGYELNEIIGLNLSNFTIPKQHEFFKKQTEYRKKNKSSIYEATFIHKNGNLVKVLVHASPYINENNEIIGTIGVIVDITYHKYLINRINELEKAIKQYLNEKHFELQTILKSLKAPISLLPKFLNFYEKNKDIAIEETIKKYLFSLIKTVYFIEVLQQNKEKRYLYFKENLLNKIDFLSEVNKIIKEYEEVNYSIITNIVDTLENNTSIIHKALLEFIHLFIYFITFKLENKQVKLNIQLLDDFIKIVITTESKDVDKIENDPWYVIFLNVHKNIMNIEIKINKDSLGIKYIYNQKNITVSNNADFDETTYTTHLIKGKTLLILSENEMLIMLIKNIMSKIDVHIIYPLINTNIISFIVENNFVDFLFIDTSIINQYEDKYNFISIVDKFYKDVPRLFLSTEKTQCENITEKCIFVDENLEKNIYAFVCKYVRYGQPN